jgi:hypothetical protein
MRFPAYPTSARQFAWRLTLLAPVVTLLFLTGTASPARAQTDIDTDATITEPLPGVVRVGANTDSSVLITVLSGGAIDLLECHNNALVRSRDGGTLGYVSLSGQSRLEVGPNSYVGQVDASAGSYVSLQNVNFGEVHAVGQSTVDIARLSERVGGGDSTWVDVRENATVRLFSGGVTTFWIGSDAQDVPSPDPTLLARAYVYGGVLDDVQFASLSEGFIFGGRFVGPMMVSGSLNIFGGTIQGYGLVSGSGTINISGGIFGSRLPTVGAGATVNLFGYDLALTNPQPFSVTGGGAFGGLESETYWPTTGTVYDVSGRLADGTPLDGRRIYVGTGGRVNLGAPATVPETGAFVLYSLGAATMTASTLRRRYLAS